jgi:hypothetical protein
LANVSVLVCVAGFTNLSETPDGHNKPGHLFGELTAEVKATTANEKRTATTALRMM